MPTRACPSRSCLSLDRADTTALAVNAIVRWWQKVGTARFREAERILVTADAGGFDGYRLTACDTQPLQHKLSSLQV
jgi:hypothetical protein